jgi:hypothetical protein
VRPLLPSKLNRGDTCNTTPHHLVFSSQEVGENQSGKPSNLAAVQRAPDGQVVAVRITSEHAEDGFKPTCGHVDELHFRSTPEVWGYFSVKPGGQIHEFSDSQFGHVFAKGTTRAAAIRSMVVALKEVKIRGEIRTLLDYVIDMLQEPEFLGNRIHTGWLDRRIAARVRVERPPWYLCVIAGAVHFALQELSANTAEVRSGGDAPRIRSQRWRCSHSHASSSDASVILLPHPIILPLVIPLVALLVVLFVATLFKLVQYIKYLEKCQSAPPSLSLTAFQVSLMLEHDRFAIAVSRTAPDGYELTLNDTSVDVVVRKLTDGSILIQVDGSSHVIHAEEETSGTRLIIDNLTCLLPNERDPSCLLAHSPGKLIRCAHPAAELLCCLISDSGDNYQRASPSIGACRYLVPDGCHLEQDKPFAEMEAMKQIMLLIAPASGFIHFHVLESCTLSTGDLVATLDLDAPESISKGSPFTGGWPELSQPQVVSDGMHHVYADALHAAEMVLAGFSSDVEGVLHDLLDVLRDGELPFAVWEEQWGSLRALIPSDVSSRMAAIIHAARVPFNMGGGATDAIVPDFPAAELRQELLECVRAAPVSEQRRVESASAHALNLVSQLEGGAGALSRSVARNILERFLESERPFAVCHGDGWDTDAIDALRRDHSGNLQLVLDVLLSHQALPSKALLVLGVLNSVVARQPQLFRQELSQLAALPAFKPLALVVQRAQQLLETSLLTQLSAEISAALVPQPSSGSGSSGTGTWTDAGTSSPGGQTSVCEKWSTPATRSEISSRSGWLASSAAGGHRALKLAVSKVAEELQRQTCLEDKCDTSARLCAAIHLSSRAQCARGRSSAALAGLCPTACGSGTGHSAQGTDLCDTHTVLTACRLAVLVDAPASVEEAVALLLGTHDNALRHIACVAYIRRLYSPFLVTNPVVIDVGVPAFHWLFEAAISSGEPPLSCRCTRRRPEAIPQSHSSLFDR